MTPDTDDLARLLSEEQMDQLFRETTNNSVPGTLNRRYASAIESATRAPLLAEIERLKKDKELAEQLAVGALDAKAQAEAKVAEAVMLVRAYLDLMESDYQGGGGRDLSGGKIAFVRAFLGLPAAEGK